MLSRRKFIQSSSLISLSPLVPSIFNHSARASKLASDEKVLVVIQLDGGNDGLNTVVPFDDDIYLQSRQELLLDTEKLHTLDDRLALHPRMEKAKMLFDDGLFSIIQNVGYPNPDRSHFRSMNIWHTASFDAVDNSSYGWLGKTLDHRTEIQTNFHPENAIFVGEQDTPVALWGRRSSATALAQADDLRLQTSSILSAATAPELPASGSLQQFVTRQVTQAYADAKEFERQQSTQSNLDYPDTPLASRLKTISFRGGRKASRKRRQMSEAGSYHGPIRRSIEATARAFLSPVGGRVYGEGTARLAPFDSFGTHLSGGRAPAVRTGCRHPKSGQE